MLKAYGMKFRHKGDKDYVCGVFFAKNDKEAGEQICKWMKSDDNDGVDQRTVSWEGTSIPLSNGTEPFFIHGKVEEMGS